MEHQVKATAIIAGYAGECAKTETPYNPAKDLAELIAQLTSPDRNERKLADAKVSLYATKGGYQPAERSGTGKTKPKKVKAERVVDPNFPNRGKVWDPLDSKRLDAMWKSNMTLRTLEALSTYFGRTPGAICAHLAKIGNHGDREEIRLENVRRGGEYGSLSQSE